MATLALEERLNWMVEQHRVAYELWPAKVVRAGTLRAVGCDLVLAGTHEAPRRTAQLA